MASTDVPIVQISGRYLYQGNERFIARGVVYQGHDITWKSSGPQDPLSDDRIERVRRDIDNFKELGVNALWIYYIDPTLSHDLCMDALAASGIYIIAGVTSNRHCIHRNRPRDSYTTDIKAYYAKVVDCLSPYANVMGVCVTNNLINSGCGEHDQVREICEVTSTAIYDLRTHMQSQNGAKGQRILPICISDSSWALLNTQILEYLTDEAVEGRIEEGKVDFYCFNFYQSGTESTNSESSTLRTNPSMLASEVECPSFDDMHLHPKFMDMKLPIPILVSEYSSSNRARPRSFSQVNPLYSRSEKTASDGTTRPPMLNVFSGGFVYEYNEGANRYGLVKVEQNSTLTKLSDYQVFKDKMLATMDSQA